MEKNKTEEQLVAADYAEVIAKCERWCDNASLIYNERHR